MARPRAASARQSRAQEYFTLLGRRLIGALSEVTADGYVFRVDMRLRPNGDAGPLVCGLGMLEEYFYVQGREWERYAWIKGRLVSEGDSASAGRLEQQLGALSAPFIYRRYLDFGAIGAIRSLHGADPSGGSAPGRAAGPIRATTSSWVAAASASWNSAPRFSS